MSRSRGGTSAVTVGPVSVEPYCDCIAMPRACQAPSTAGCATAPATTHSRMEEISVVSNSGSAAMSVNIAGIELKWVVR
jgi:hypothetical protein